MKTEWREAPPSGYYLRKSVSRYINANLFYESAEKFVEFLKEKKILVGEDSTSITGSTQVPPI